LRIQFLFKITQKLLKILSRKCNIDIFGKFEGLFRNKFCAHDLHGRPTSDENGLAKKPDICGRRQNVKLRWRAMGFSPKKIMNMPHMHLVGQC
jgi:hypothetical protein